jgi:hypothetical protein
MKIIAVRATKKTRRYMAEYKFDVFEAPCNICARTCILSVAASWDLVDAGAEVWCNECVAKMPPEKVEFGITQAAARELSIMHEFESRKN